MVKLRHFNSGDVILSTEVNANFTALAQVVGTTSTSQLLSLPGKLALGERDGATISALTDKASASTGYLHLGWNATEVTDGSGNVKLNRVGNLSDGSTVVRVGSEGLAVLGTASATSDLSTMPTLFAIRKNEGVFINSALSFTQAAQPNSIDDYRLTFVPLNTPVNILTTDTIPNRGDDYSLQATRQINNWLSMPGRYRGVQLRVQAQRGADTRSTGRIEIYGERTDPLTGILFFANNTGLNITKGPVFFHKGEKDNDKVLINVKHELQTLRVDIVGVWK